MSTTAHPASRTPSPSTAPDGPDHPVGPVSGVPGAWRPEDADLVADVVDYAIFGLDTDGVIRSWNAGAQALKGWTEEEAVGRHFSMLYPGTSRREGLPERLLEQARAEGRVEHEGLRVRRDGTTFWGRVVLTAVRDDDGRLVGYTKVTRDLTEHRQREQDLEQSEAGFRQLVSQVVDYAIISLDEGGHVTSWNAGAERLKGWTEAEVVGRPSAVFYDAEDRRAGLPEALLCSARRDGRVEHEGWRVRRDGTPFWADVVITLRRDADGRPCGFTKVTRDLTRQHQLHTELRESEERFRSLVSQVQDYAIIALDPSGTIRSWNAGAAALKGYTEDQAVGRSFTMFYGEDDRRDGLPQQLLTRAAAHGSVEHQGWRVRRDGTRFWGDVVLTALRDDEGVLTGFSKVTRDLTEQHQLQEELASSEERFRTLVSQVQDYAIIALDAGGTIRSWNAGAEAVKGYSAAQAVGRSFTMFYSPEDRRDGLPGRLLEQAARDGRVQHSGWRLRRDGSRFWGDVVITALRDEQGTLVGYSKVTRDRTEQHALEGRLRESEARFRTLVANVVDYAIVALDEQGRVATWNAGAQRVHGHAESEVRGASYAVFCTPEERAEGVPDALLATARREGRVETTGWRVRSDGSRFWANVVMTALVGDDGRASGFAVVTRDMSDIKRLETVQDSFYATFEHDFRSPVTAIRGFASLLREQEVPGFDHYLARIEDNADTLLAMILDLVEFARLRSGDTPLTMEPADLAALAAPWVSGLPHVNDRRIRVETVGPVPVTIDKVALGRVVTNLVANALKYSEPDTEVLVRVGTERGEAVLTVTDHGRGIAPEDLRTIFDEFQRGRLAEDDGGTGLGLASAKKLVTLHGGRISCRSGLGAGTTMTVVLPLRELA